MRLQCLEFSSIIATIDSVNGDLIHLSEVAEVNDNRIEDAATGLDKCKVCKVTIKFFLKSVSKISF